MKTYQHLFFDLDHTLWDFDTNARTTLEELYTEFDMHRTVTPLFDDFYQKYLYHNEILWNRYHQGLISADELKWKRMWRTLLEFRIGHEQMARDMSQRFLEVLPTKRALFPYTIEILDYLTAKGYQLHLITNGFEQTQWKKLNNSGLEKYFVEVITSEGSNSVKPNREIFDYALLKTGANLHTSIMLGDNPEADILGAINAGMDSVFVNHHHATIDYKPTYTVNHLSELEKIF